MNKSNLINTYHKAGFKNQNKDTLMRIERRLFKARRELCNSQLTIHTFENWNLYCDYDLDPDMFHMNIRNEIFYLMKARRYMMS